MLSEPGKAR